MVFRKRKGRYFMCALVQGNVSIRYCYIYPMDSVRSKTFVNTIFPLKVVGVFDNTTPLHSVSIEI
jgi:Zn-finger protein